MVFPPETGPRQREPPLSRPGPRAPGNRWCHRSQVPSTRWDPGGRLYEARRALASPAQQETNGGWMRPAQELEQGESGGGGRTGGRRARPQLYLAPRLLPSPWRWGPAGLAEVPRCLCSRRQHPRAARCHCRHHHCRVRSRAAAAQPRRLALPRRCLCHQPPRHRRAGRRALPHARGHGVQPPHPDLPPPLLVVRKPCVATTSRQRGEPQLRASAAPPAKMSRRGEGRVRVRRSTHPADKKRNSTSARACGRGRLLRVQADAPDPRIPRHTLRGHGAPFVWRPAPTRRTHARRARRPYSSPQRPPARRRHARRSRTPPRRSPHDPRQGRATAVPPSPTTLP